MADTVTAERSSTYTALNNLEQSARPPKAKLRPKWWWNVLVVVPYVVGILWHFGLHVSSSVLTGDFDAPRRWYIDENSLEPSYFRMQHKYEAFQRPPLMEPCNMCQAMPQMHHVADGFNDTLVCEFMGTQNELQVIQVIPKAAGVVPVHEAIVYVVPFSLHWTTSQLHTSIAYFATRLAAAPWLAKTIFIVSAAVPDMSLQATTDLFLRHYLQDAAHSAPTSRISRTAMVRQLIVLDLEVTESGGGGDGGGAVWRNIQVLPQGRLGVLPNMDLVWVTVFCYRRSTILDTRSLGKIATTSAATMSLHPYRRELRAWHTWWNTSKLPEQLYGWWERVLDLLAFEYTLLHASPATLPHAGALHRGIDALTLRLQLSGEDFRPQSRHVADWVEKLELLTRSLGNLHERLHHSTSLYVVPSVDHYVKHEEYLVPNLLVVIPGLLRGLMLLVTLEYFAWADVGLALFAVSTAVSTAAFCLPVLDYLRVNWPWAVYYLPFALSLAAAAFLAKDISSRSRASIQLVACLAMVYLHVPIAFGYVALAFPSAMVWTPLLALPSYSIRSGNESSSAVRLMRAMLPVLVLHGLQVNVPHMNSGDGWSATYKTYCALPLSVLFVLLTAL